MNIIIHIIPNVECVDFVLLSVVLPISSWFISQVLWQSNKTAMSDIGKPMTDATGLTTIKQRETKSRVYSSAIYHTWAIDEFSMRNRLSGNWWRILILFLSIIRNHWQTNRRARRLVFHKKNCNKCRELCKLPKMKESVNLIIWQYFISARDSVLFHLQMKKRVYWDDPIDRNHISTIMMTHSVPTTHLV